MFRGTICCSGFAWDRSITLPVASQELSQNSFCCCPNKKGFWSVASVGKLSLKLRVNKSPDRGMEPCGGVASPLHPQLCSKSVLHTHSEQAALSCYCNHSLAAMVKITVSKGFLPGVHHSGSVFLPRAASLSHSLRVAEKDLLNSLKAGGTGWSLGQREKRVHEQAGGSAEHPASRWRVQGVEQRGGKLWDCPV